MRMIEQNLNEKKENGQVRSTYLPEVDVAKGVAILGVLIAHAGAEGDFGEYLSWLRLALGWCVAAFFTFAGFLEGRPGKVLPFGEHICSRAHRLLVPWALLHCLNNIALFIMARMGVVHSEVIQHASWWKVLLSEWSPQLYFLPWLFFIDGFLWYVLRRNPWVTTMLLTGLVIASSLCWAGRNYGYGPHAENLPIYAAAYAIGFSWRRDVSLIWPSLVLVIAMNYELFRHGTYQAIHPLMGCGLIVVARTIHRGLSMFEAIGRWSFGIYLWHVPVVMPMCHLLGRQFELTAGVNLAFMLVATVMICMAWGLFLSRTPFRLLVQ